MRSWRMGGCTEPFMENGTRGTSQYATCCFCCDTRKGWLKWTKKKNTVGQTIKRWRKGLRSSWKQMVECPKVNCVISKPDSDAKNNVSVLERWWGDEGQTDRQTDFNCTFLYPQLNKSHYLLRYARLQLWHQTNAKEYHLFLIICPF